jgi:hypothetical protein
MSHVLPQFASAGGHGADRVNLLSAKRVRNPGKRSAPPPLGRSRPRRAGTPLPARFACQLRSLPGSTWYVPLSGGRADHSEARTVGGVLTAAQ